MYVNTYIHPSIHPSIHACMHTCILTHTCTYIHIQTHTNTYIHIYMHTCIRTYVHAYINIHIHTLMTYTYTCTYTSTYTYTDIHTNIPTYLPAYVRTHAHMYIRTCTYSRVLTGSPGMDDRPIRDGRKLSVHVGLLAKPSALCGGRPQTQNPKKNRVQNPRPLKNSPSFDCSMTGLCTATQVATQAWVRVFGVGL